MAYIFNLGGQMFFLCWQTTPDYMKLLSPCFPKDISWLDLTVRLMKTCCGLACWVIEKQLAGYVLVHTCVWCASVSKRTTSLHPQPRPASVGVPQTGFKHHDVSTSKDDESLSEPHCLYYCARVYSLLTMFWCKINREPCKAVV